jgi:hypothetical protein
MSAPRHRKAHRYPRHHRGVVARIAEAVAACAPDEDIVAGPLHRVVIQLADAKHPLRHPVVHRRLAAHISDPPKSVSSPASPQVIAAVTSRQRVVSATPSSRIAS